MIENFGRNVARLRKEKGMTQEELAEKIDVKKQTISNIERGERYPTFENLEKISQVLNANAIQLFGTANEIAVSDTPVVLDRIDEYSGKVHAILKVEKLLSDEFFLRDVNKTVQDIQTITNFEDTNHPLEYIRELVYMIYDINRFINGGELIDEDGAPVLDDNNRPRIGKPAIESVPFDKITRAREDIEFILANKDKV